MGQHLFGWKNGELEFFCSLGEKGALVSERADTKKITGGMSFPLFREEIFKQAAYKSK